MNASTNSVIKQPIYYKPETADMFAALLSSVKANAANIPPTLAKLQNSSAQLFADYGVPYPKLERWKYSNFYPALKKHSFSQSLNAETWGGDIAYLKPMSEVLNEPWVQGILSQSAPESGELKDDNAFWYLNDAQCNIGWVIDIPANVELDKPLCLESINGEGAYNAMRIIIRLGKNARAVVKENHRSENADARYFKNWVTQVELAEGAHLTHLRTQNDGLQAAYVQNTHVKLSRNAEFYSLTTNTGAHIFRNQYQIDMDGEGAHASVRSSANVADEQHIDFTSCVNHNVKSCTSEQIVRNVLGGKATGVFQGKAYVKKGADFTDGSQSSKAILLSPYASMHAKPELEIYADEVKCAHGSTCGALDEGALFYARSRGVPFDDARMMLVHAFLEEVKHGLPIADQQ
tara:strand:+ start:34477 stop:35691 length:1215 start_codon:yes stop_codon:yes gene_type:complete